MVKITTRPDAKHDWALDSAVQTPWTLAHERIEKGVQVRRYRKNVLRTGDFVKAADGLRFQITDADLIHFRDTFLAMQAAGVKVPVPLGHSFEPDRNKGYLVDLFARPGVLEGVIDLYGPDGDVLAATNDVSIYAPAEFTDGSGKTYRRPIVHVALTPYPVVTNLGAFQAISASLVEHKEPQMDLKKVKDSLGIKEDLTDANAADLICAAFGGIRQELDGLKAAAKKAADDEKAKAAAAAADGAPNVTDERQKAILASHVNLLCKNRRMQLDGLVAKGKITPAVRDKMLAMYGDPSALSLSLGEGDQFDNLVATLEINEPRPAAGEKTGPQVLELSNDNIGDPTKNPMVAWAQKHAEAAAKK